MEYKIYGIIGEWELAIRESVEEFNPESYAYIWRKEYHCECWDLHYVYFSLYSDIFKHFTKKEDVYIKSIVADNLNLDEKIIKYNNKEYNIEKVVLNSDEDCYEIYTNIVMKEIMKFTQDDWDKLVNKVNLWNENLNAYNKSLRCPKCEGDNSSNVSLLTKIKNFFKKVKEIII